MQTSLHKVLNHSVEFTGPGVETLSIDERLVGF